MYDLLSCTESEYVVFFVCVLNMGIIKTLTNLDLNL